MKEDEENEAFDTYFNAAKKDDVVEVERLLNNFPHFLNETNDFGATALRISSGFGSLNVARVLIEKGADLDLEDSDFKETPFLAAIRYKHYDIAVLLIQSGANFDCLDNFYRSPLHIALKIAIKTERDDILQALLVRGAKFTTELIKECSCEFPDISCIERLISCCDINCQTSVTLDFSEEGTFNIDIRIDKGNTALMEACFGCPVVIQTLLDAGADVNLRNSNGETALFFATQSDFASISHLQMLLERGSEIIPNSDGVWPFDVSSQTEKSQYLQKVFRERILLTIVSIPILGKYRDILKIVWSYIFGSHTKSCVRDAQDENRD